MRGILDAPVTEPSPAKPLIEESFPSPFSYLTDCSCHRSIRDWQRHSQTHYLAATHRQAWSSCGEPHYSVMSQIPDLDCAHQRCSRCKKKFITPRDAGFKKHPKLTIDHLDLTRSSSHTLDAPRSLDFVDCVSRKLLHCINLVVSVRMRKRLLLLSSLCFAGAVADGGSCSNSNIDNQSATTSLSLRPYTEGLLDTQNFLVSVESHSNSISNPLKLLTAFPHTALDPPHRPSFPRNIRQYHPPRHVPLHEHRRSAGPGW